MSARSSSGSWSGACGTPPDIIDLDKFMRGAVRPKRNDHQLSLFPAILGGDKLVVDAGGVDRKRASLSAAAASLPLAALPPVVNPSLPPPHTTPSDTSEDRAPPHGKRYSHDSGLSDTSYARRKHRPHRRAVVGDNTGERTAIAPAAGSSNSLRAFRAVCERALLDQQAQIARVTQLCERLSEHPSPAPPQPRRRSGRSLSDTSDVSSSSRSTYDARRKDKHRTDECKTYKIIMNKLEEINTLFAARARSSPPAHHPPPTGRRPVSSGSVSVSDKLCSTEALGKHPADLHVAHNVVTIRGDSTNGACRSCGVAPLPAMGSGPANPMGMSARLSALRIATKCAQDIASGDALLRIVPDSMLHCESCMGTGTNGGDPRCGFDLDDPVHLYSQAKRLQAMSASTRRAHSVEPSAKCFPRSEQSQRSHRSARADSHTRTHDRPRDGSLCSLCRGYWRSLMHYLVAQIFCCPDAAVK